MVSLNNSARLRHIGPMKRARPDRSTFSFPFFHVFFPPSQQGEAVFCFPNNILCVCGGGRE